VKRIVASIKPRASFFSDDAFLKPVLAEDPLLFELDEFDDDDDAFEAGGQHEDAEEDCKEEEEEEEDSEDGCPDLDEDEDDDAVGADDSAAVVELGGLEQQNAVLRRQLGTVKAKLDKVMGVMGNVVADYDRTCGSCGQRQGASSDCDYMLDFLAELAKQSPEVLQKMGISKAKHQRAGLLGAIKQRSNGAAQYLEGSSGTGSARPLAAD
jgi:hypothetical protein